MNRTHSLLQKKALTERRYLEIWIDLIYVCAHYKCRGSCHLTTAGIRDNVERQCIGANLDTLVDKYQKGQLVFTDSGVQSGERFPKIRGQDINIIFR
jgi:hypothetical protein